MMTEWPEYPQVPIGLPKVNGLWEWPSESLKLAKTKCKPVYGWNPLRWLFRRPLRWDITFHFETQPQETSKP